MRIRSLNIQNFRAIRELSLDDLSDAIVIAGPNGCGKSCIFDALRLLKSSYGRYHSGEYQNWFNEFQIDVQRLGIDSERIFHDPSSPISITVEFSVSEEERLYLRNHAVEHYKRLRWAQLVNPNVETGEIQLVHPTQSQGDRNLAAQEIEKLNRALQSTLHQEIHVGCVTVDPGEAPIIRRSPLLELVFAVYSPAEIGIIDYHGPTRTYGRERIGGIQLTLRDASSQMAQHALYNTAGKYANVKTEMAQSYVSELIAEKAGTEVNQHTSLKRTLDELFTSFFPGKTFLGTVPKPDGALEFPVRLENGREHDINELSSGEKEVLLGYLRLRNSAPKNSIILLDEPELHLNPRLAHSLPRFYEKHLSKALGNQIWLVTHSDAILREAVRLPGYSVFHMQYSTQVPEGINQIDRINLGSGIESAIVDLVGDLATYSPRSKVVLLEGDNSELDASFLKALFPKFSESVNLVSLGSKRSVRSAHDALERAGKEGRLDARFFSIVDRDYDGQELSDPERQYQWDRYHIENYLLHSSYIREAISSITLQQPASEDFILEQLRRAAEETIPGIIRVKLERYVNAELVKCLSLRFDRQAYENVSGFVHAAKGSMERIAVAVREKLTEEHLREFEAAEEEALRKSLSSNEWVASFRGRDVLKRFTSYYGTAFRYEQLRNLVLSRMAEASYRPEGMERVIQKIVDDTR